MKAKTPFMENIVLISAIISFVFLCRFFGSGRDYDFAEHPPSKEMGLPSVSFAEKQSHQDVFRRKKKEIE